MNNFKSCILCVCTGSGHKQICEEHDNNIQNTDIMCPNKGDQEYSENSHRPPNE